MALVEIGELGRGGVISDIPPYDLPLHAWSDALNVEFDRDGVSPMSVESEILGAAQVNPLGLWSFLTDINSQDWIYAGEAKIYSVVDGVHTDITRAVGGDYTASTSVKWNGGIINGVPVLNNGFDKPQQLDPTDLTAKAIDLTNWPASLTTLVLRPFGNFLIALGATDSGITFPGQSLVWSDPADPGTVPPSWDWASPSTQAGIKTFSESSGVLVDGLTLRKEFMIYKTDSIWAMRFIGGTFVFSFEPRFEDVGLLTADAVVAFEKAHFVVTANDMIVHDGISKKSVADDLVRNRVFTEINPEFVSNVFVQHEPGKNRIWVFYPTAGAQWCNRAAIWNYRENTWTFRETPYVSAARKGLFDLDLGDIWDSEGATWDNLDIARYWDGSVLGATQSNIIMTSFVGAATYDAGTDTSTDGNVTWSGNTTYPPFWLVKASANKMDGYVQRTGLAVAGKDHTGKATVNKKLRKELSEIWPEVSVGFLRVRVGTQETPQSAVVWYDYQDFDPTTDLKIDEFRSSKFIAIEFRSQTTQNDWNLSGYALEIEPGSLY